MARPCWRKACFRRRPCCNRRGGAFSTPANSKAPAAGPASRGGFWFCYGCCAARHRIGRNVARHHAVRGNNGPVAYLHARHHRAHAAKPHVVAHHGVAPARQLGHVRRHALGPLAAKHGKRVGGRAAQPVVGRAHHKLRAAANGAEFANHQPVAKLRPVEQHVALFKMLRPRRIVVIGVISNFNVWRLYHVFQKACGAKFVRENIVRVRVPVFLCHCSGLLFLRFASLPFHGPLLRPPPAFCAFPAWRFSPSLCAWPLPCQALFMGAFLRPAFYSLLFLA